MPSTGFDAMSFLPIVLMFLIFYFLVLRPQQTKMKKHQTMLSELKKGDRIITSGGILGTISKLIDSNEIQLEIAENVKIRVLRSSIGDVIRGVPHEDNKKSLEVGGSKGS